jgi:hypothetical protein
MQLPGASEPVGWPPKWMSRSAALAFGRVPQNIRLGEGSDTRAIDVIGACACAVEGIVKHRHHLKSKPRWRESIGGGHRFFLASSSM